MQQGEGGEARGRALGWGASAWGRGLRGIVGASRVAKVVPPIAAAVGAWQQGWLRIQGERRSKVEAVGPGEGHPLDLEF